VIKRLVGLLAGAAMRSATKKPCYNTLLVISPVRSAPYYQNMVEISIVDKCSGATVGRTLFSYNRKSEIAGKILNGDLSGFSVTSEQPE
jgi:hypothetical protein